MRHNGHIRQRSKDSFEIRYNLGNDPLTGKRRTVTTTIKGERKEAEKELRRLLRSLDTNEHVEPNKIRVGDYLTQWLDASRSQVSPKTHERYTELINHFLIEALGGSYLTKLDAYSIQQAYNKWETSGRKDGKRGGLAPRTRLHIHRVFRTALKRAVKLRLISYNPADDVIAPKVRKSTITTLNVEQSAVLLKALQDKNSRMYWPVLLAITTGMRRGEIVALRWQNVDFENRTIRVVESIEQVGTKLRVKAPKTETTRAVTMSDYTFEELKAWKENQAKELANLGVKVTEDTFVCGRSWDGGVLKPDSLSAEFRVAIREIPDIPVIRFHDLRHSHATQLLKLGIHPKIAQERLGHSTITTTIDLYSHVVETMQTDAVSKLDSAYRPVMKAQADRNPKLG